MKGSNNNNVKEAVVVAQMEVTTTM